MSTPSFRVIRKKHPQSEIYLLIGEWSKPVVENNPDIDKLIIIDENIFWEKKLFQLLKLFWKLKNYNFNVVYNMHWSKFFNIFIRLLNIPERIGFDRDHEGIFLTRKVAFQEGVKGIHIIDRYLQLATNDYLSADRRIKIYLKHDEIQTARKKLNAILPNFHKSLVGIAPGGGENPKMSMVLRRWPVEYYSLLIEMVRQQLKLPVLIFGGPNDLPVVKNIFSMIKRENEVIDFVGKTTIREAAAVMSLCSVMITNDSGLLHLAASVNTPTLSIFGPTAPYDKVPIGEMHSFLYKSLECSPCYRFGKFPNCIKVDCLKSIKPDEVFEELKKKLKR